MKHRGGKKVLGFGLLALVTSAAIYFSSNSFMARKAMQRMKWRAYGLGLMLSQRLGAAKKQFEQKIDSVVEQFEGKEMNETDWWDLRKQLKKSIGFEH